MRANNRVRSAAMLTAVLAVIAVLFTVLVMVVDVKPVGPENSSVGFAALNQAFAKAVGVNKTLYTLTQLLGYLALLLAACFGLLGLLQLIRVRSLKRVDRSILALGCLYVAVLVLYVLFDKFAVNYRPVILDEGLEASYPSSHTMLTITVMGSAILELERILDKVRLRRMLQAAFGAIMVVTILGRLFSGVHWFTDILGGMLISAALLAAFYTVLQMLDEKKLYKSRRDMVK